jgi:hypothetical protein
MNILDVATTPEHKDGTTTFEEYLENRYPRSI